MAARQLGSFMALPENMIKKDLNEFRSCLMPLISPGPRETTEVGEAIRLMEVPWSEDWEKRANSISRHEGSALVSIRLPLCEGVEETVLSLVESGISIIHLEATSHGRAADRASRFLKDGIRAIHQALVEHGTRDGITLLASGGLSMGTCGEIHHLRGGRSHH